MRYKHFVITAILATIACAQGPTGTQSVVLATPSTPEQKLFFYDASSNLAYVCVARQKNAATAVQISDSTLTSIAVSSTTATVTTVPKHGLYVGALVTVSGVTTDTDLNGTYKVQSIPSDTTYTFTVANVTAGTYNGGTDSGMAISTTFPLTTASLWAVQVFSTTTSLLRGVNWANSNVAYNMACTSGANY